MLILLVSSASLPDSFELPIFMFWKISTEEQIGDIL